MKVLFYLHHPAHYHMFKNVIKSLQEHGHTCIIFAIKKDILTDLLDADGVKYINNLPVRRKNSKFSMAWNLLKQDFGLFKHVLFNRPDLMLGTSPEICHVGKLLMIPSYFFSEDDAKVIALGAQVSYPFANSIISPCVCSAGKWEYKKIGYEGYQKLAYLHPRFFTPDKELIKNSIDLSKPYFLLRSVSLTAHHDDNKKGFNQRIIDQLLEILLPLGNVYISSEGIIDKKYEKYNLNLDIRNIHHALYYASFYIGDSQSMAVEAALLGVPGIRFNDFAGKISVLEELENKYQLTFAYKTSNPEKMLIKLKELLKIDDLKVVWLSRREKMLSEKIDLTAFLLWFIENYPSSLKVLKNNTKYYETFK